MKLNFPDKLALERVWYSLDWIDRIEGKQIASAAFMLPLGIELEAGPLVVGTEVLFKLRGGRPGRGEIIASVTTQEEDTFAVPIGITVK